MSCRELEVLLSLRAADALDARETARVEAHLASCPECHAAADEAVRALSLATLPPVSDAERRALRDLPVRTLAAYRLSKDRRFVGKQAAVVVAAIAASMAVVVAPALVGKWPEAPGVAAEATWQGPDLDAVWEDTGVLDLDASAPEGGEDADAAALAALEL